MTKKPDIVTAAILLIGNELLSGRTKDANLNYIARQLVVMGIHLREVRVIADEEGDIVSAVNDLRVRYNYVFTTGGIGPTHDDITSKSIAKAMGRPYVLSKKAKSILQEYYDGLDRELNSARLQMAHIPEGAKLIRNSISQAPGFRIENVIVMAGIPAVMRAMFEDVAGVLKCGTKTHSRSMSVMLGEGDIATPLSDLQQRYACVEIGSYPFNKDRRFGTTLVLRGIQVEQVNSAYEELWDIIMGLGVLPEEETASSDGT